VNKDVCYSVALSRVCSVGGFFILLFVQNDYLCKNTQHMTEQQEKDCEANACIAICVMVVVLLLVLPLFI
jgi:hypothetical protein